MALWVKVMHSWRFGKGGIGILDKGWGNLQTTKYLHTMLGGILGVWGICLGWFHTDISPWFLIKIEGQT